MLQLAMFNYRNLILAGAKLPWKGLAHTCSPVVLKLCVATPRCVVSIFEGRRGIFWLCVIKSRFYCVKTTLIVDSFLLTFSR